MKKTTKRKPAAPAKYNPFKLVTGIRPLDPNEGRELSNYARIAQVALLEGHATYSQLGELWLRARVAYMLLEHIHAKRSAEGQMALEEARPLCEAVQEFYLLHVLNKDLPIAPTPAFLSDLDILLELADELQKETNAHHLLTVYKAALAYTKATKAQAEAAKKEASSHV